MGEPLQARLRLRLVAGEFVRQSSDRGFDEAFLSLGLAEPSPNGHAEKNGGPKTFTAASLMALELPEIRWAVPGILPEGITLLAGKPKLGKSWFAFGLAIATASGGVALGTRSVA